MQVIAYDDDFLPRVSSGSQKKRHRRRASSLCGVPISPNLLADGGRRSFSYDKLPQQPLRLTIRKLDGSSFDVEVARTATVADLKEAVEGLFSHMPTEGPGKISWSHVWGHFCFCYDSWKLLVDSEPISNFGINDGDQLHFVRHVSIRYNLIKKRSKDKSSALELSRRLDGSVKREHHDDKNHSPDDPEISKHRDQEDEKEIVKRCYELKLGQLLGGWFSYRRLGSSPRRKRESNLLPSRLGDGFLGSFRNIIRLFGGNKLNSHRDPLDEV